MRNLKLTRLFSSRCLGILTGLAMCLPMTVTAATTGKNVVIGYYFLSTEQINNYSDDLRDYPVSRISDNAISKLTHINFSFLNINENGECAFEDGVDADKGAEVLNKLLALKSKNSALRINVTLGGWDNSNDDSTTVERYRNAVSSTENQNKLALSCMQFLQRYQLDGLDIDWEYPRPQDAAGYLDLLTALRNLMNQETSHHYQLSIAGAGGAFTLARYYPQLLQMAAQLDYINLMTYDLNGPWQKLSNHNAHLFGDPAEPMYDNPLRSVIPGTTKSSELAVRFPTPFALTVDAAVQQYLNAGVARNKLVLGLPFYGRAFFQDEPDNHGLLQAFVTQAGDEYFGDPSLLYGCDTCALRNEPRLAGYDEITKLLTGNFGYVRYFSHASKVPWLYNAEKKIFVSYDDAESFRYKSKYVKQQGLAGVMYWRMGQDDGADTLLNTLHDALNDLSYCDQGLDMRGGVMYNKKIALGKSTSGKQCLKKK